MNRVLFDLCMVLDLFLNRAPWAADMAVLWDAQRNRQIDAHLAAVSFPTLFSIVRRQADLATARQAVQACLATLIVLPIDQATVAAALTLPGSDYEDNLQIACAVQAVMDGIVTRDPRGFTHSPVPALSPADLVARLNPPGSP